MIIITDPQVETVFKQYPSHLKEKLYFLRSLIIETASTIQAIETLHETLKWGEPSYIVKQGSTIRINAKKSAAENKATDCYAIYFNCKTKLLDTFKEVYADVFTYESNRAIVISYNDTPDVEALKHCIELALTYHQRKHLPLLGV